MNITANTPEQPDEEIAAVLAELRERHSSAGHRMEELYTFTEDCEHINPDDDPAYDGVDDLVDAWIEQHLFGLTYADGRLYWRNRDRAYGVIPLAAALDRAEREFGDQHNRVCLASPMGEHCATCDELDGEGGEDFGFDPSGCRRTARAREEREEFWAVYAS